MIDFSLEWGEGWQVKRPSINHVRLKKDEIMKSYYQKIAFIIGFSLFLIPVVDAAVTHWQQDQWNEVFQPGGRIGYVDSNGNLKVRANSDTNAPWVAVAQKVKDFQLRDTRIAVRQSDGRLQVWDGSLHQMRGQVIDTDAAAYQLGVSRVGILHSDGTFLVASWGAPTPVAFNVRAFQVLPDRIGILGFDGSFWVQEGLSTEKFHKIADDVINFQMDQEWVAYLDRSDTTTRLMLGRGQIAGIKFVKQATNVEDFEMEVWQDDVEHNEHRVRLAYSDGTTVYSGIGHLEPMIMHKDFFNHFDNKPVPGMRAQKVHWSGGKIVSEESGAVNIDVISQDGELRVSVATGQAEDVRWNSEGAVLTLERNGHLRLCCDKRGGSDIITSVMIDGKVPPGRKPNFEISSQHPAFSRRPVAMPEEIAKETRVQAVVFVGELE